MSDETADDASFVPEGHEGGVATEAPPEAPDADAAGREVEVAAAPPPAALEAGPPAVDPVRDRVLLPLLLPIVSIAAVLVLVLNISRVLLASGESGSVLVGTLITVGILGAAAAISASPRLRTSTLTMIVAGFLVVLMGAGLTTLGPSEDHGEEAGGGYQEPSGPPVATLSVDALNPPSFQRDQFEIPAGIIEVKYNDLGGTHTLAFTDPKFSGFLLEVPGGPRRKKVKLEPGSYTIYCTIPGHRAAGMEAELTVEEGPAAAEGGAGAPTTTAAS